MPGDADIAATGALLGDRTRARIVTALCDGRALPASVLACEAGIAASTASEHLAKLVDGGLLTAERHGRHRYFRLAGTDVARMIEAMACVSPPAPVTSLREGTRANALRVARTCYDHLAGRLGTGLMAAMIEGGMVDGGDGWFDPDLARRDRLSARGHDIDYRLTDRGVDALASLGVDLSATASGRRPMVGNCVDWSEQRHHLAGAVGAAVHDRAIALGWRPPAAGAGRVAHAGGRGRPGGDVRVRGRSGLGAPPGAATARIRSRGVAPQLTVACALAWELPRPSDASA